ncbi:hypothetical protein H5410_004975 [Solanum commersonii]|uniref:Uncharacterized protein n=1 Tax=Solanum commersonii TaxID=4109 RepID=A0A9J6A5C4_SOLCO|nr:hypothetical protein H5410_004975 [Solanum commersonii]
MDSELENQIGEKFEKDDVEMIQWRCLVPTTSSQGPSVALHAKPSYDSSHSGTTIDAQLRYAARTKDMLDSTA